MISAHTENKTHPQPNDQLYSKSSDIDKILHQRKQLKLSAPKAMGIEARLAAVKASLLLSA